MKYLYPSLIEFSTYELRKVWLIVLLKSDKIISKFEIIKSLFVLGIEPRFHRPQRWVLTTRRHEHLGSPIHSLPYVHSPLTSFMSIEVNVSRCKLTKKELLMLSGKEFL